MMSFADLWHNAEKRGQHSTSEQKIYTMANIHRDIYTRISKIREGDFHAIRQMVNDGTGNTPFSQQRSKVLAETPDQPSLPNLPEQQHAAAVRSRSMQVERKADVDILLFSCHAHEKSMATERLQKETKNNLSETNFNWEVDNRKCLTCKYKTAETAGENISTHDDVSWRFPCISWQMQSARTEFDRMPVVCLFVYGRSIYEENDKPVFESLKLDKTALNETRFERRHIQVQMIAAIIGETGRKYLQQKQTQDCAVLVVILLASRSCNLFLTRELPILDCKESVKMNLNSLIYENKDTHEEILSEYKVCKEKEELEAFKEPENAEDAISMHRIYSDFAPGPDSYSRQCDVENYKSTHDSDIAYTVYGRAPVPPIAHVTHHDADDTNTSCSHSVHEQTEILPISGVCWSVGVHCQEEGNGRVNRCTSDDELGSSEEDFGVIEKVTADGSASTAVSKSRRDEFTEALLFSQVDKLENVGNNENVSITLPSSKASTVPVAEELFGEKKEALALSRDKENEENNPGLKKNSDNKEPLNQNEDQTDKDVDDGQVLQNYYRHYRLRSVGQQRHQYFVYMLRSPQAAHMSRQGFESEMRRLATYVNFQPPDGVYVIRLANAGFFLPTNNSQNTGALNVLQMVLECAFCGVLVEVLKFQSRQPMEVHREASPTCPLVLGQDGRNVSIAQMAQTTGGHFLDSYLSPTAGALPYGGVPSRSNGEEYAIDGDGPTTSSAFPRPNGVGSKDNAAAKPAFMASLPAQTAIVGFAAVAQGQTVADARGLPSTQPSPFTEPALPRQTAAFEPTADCTSSQPSSVTPGNATSPAGTTQPSSPSREVENSGEGTGSSTQERQVVTYEQLGIFAQRPRRPDMAVVATRMTTFEGWPHAGSHPPSEMADAGFYYTGQADLVRCFYCRGGLRTWERSDHPWVEHGRWFPRCPFVRLCRGQKFVDAIQQLNENGASKISEEDVKREIIRKEEEAKRNRSAAVMPVSPPPPTSSKTDEDRGAVGGATTSIRADYTVGDGNDVTAMARRLQEENQELKETTLCKMCQQREVNVLFLPCGHLVACAHCAPALRVCAICRQQVKGSVRVLLDEEEDVTADQ